MADMASITQIVYIRGIFNAGRARSITQEAVAAIRRAPKNERPAMFARYARRLVGECLRVVCI